MSGPKRIIQFLGLRQSIVGLLAMVVLVGVGERLAERFLPIYLIALGGGALSIGVLNGLDNLLSALYSLPGGYLAQRLGTKRALLLFNLVAAVGFMIVILVPAWPAVLVGALFFLSWTAISLPATMELVARVLPPAKRTMGVSMHSLVRRIPMALGPIIGGAFIDAWGPITGVRLAFGAALAMALLAVVLQQTLIEDDRATPGGRPVPRGNPLRLIRNLDPALRNLLVADILVRFCEQIPYAFVVVWCLRTVAAPVTAVQFGLLTTVEMATAMLIYVPVAWLADRSTKKPFVVMTFGFFTLFPLVLLACQSFWPLVVAFVLRGLKEFGEPTRKALIMDLAPEDAKAVTFGVYYLARDTIVSLAAFGGAALWMIGPEVNLLVAFGCGVAGTVWFAVRGRDLSAARPPAPQSAHQQGEQHENG
ncbi:MAG: MFS transporter [Phycisphaerae bacterium]|jgi:MFS family permease